LVTRKREVTSLGKVEKKISTNNHPRIDFIKSVKLAGIGLDKCVASVDRSLLVQAKEREDDLEIEIKMGHSILAHEDGYFVVAADFDLAQHTSKSEKRIVSITATFSAKFNLAKPASEELISGFARLEARLIFFPYLRHFVSDTSHRMSIDAITLPLTSELE
jgi:hypothetical protein